MKFDRQPMRVIGLAGWSGAGKTTLIGKVIPLLLARGLTVSTVKHAHHSFAVDQPGKDSYVHRKAGATEVLIASGRRFALMHEDAEAVPLSLAALLQKLSPVDLIIVEGFKRECHSKLEVHRGQNGKPFLFPEDASICGLISDCVPATIPLPFGSINDVDAIVEMMWRYADPLALTLQRLSAPRRETAHGTAEQ
jgi:molybdopterin-guanine dinucleotide biosynthesis adapter protein